MRRMRWGGGGAALIHAPQSIANRAVYSRETQLLSFYMSLRYNICLSPTLGRSNKEMQYTGVNPKGIFTLVYLCPPV